MPTAISTNETDQRSSLLYPSLSGYFEADVRILRSGRTTSRQVAISDKTVILMQQKIQDWLDCVDEKLAIKKFPGKTQELTFNRNCCAKPY